MGLGGHPLRTGPDPIEQADGMHGDHLGSGSGGEPGRPLHRGHAVGRSIDTDNDPIQFHWPPPNRLTEGLSSACQFG